jgi:hypothetical protein
MGKPIAAATTFVVVLLCVVVSAGPGSEDGVAAGATVAAPDTVQVAAAGDIACGPTSFGWNDGEGIWHGVNAKCRQAETADLLAGADSILTLGDNQYERASEAAFEAGFDPTWGAYLPRIYPAFGDEEYEVPHAAAAKAYFKGSAHDMRESTDYSADIGEWHLVVIDVLRASALSQGQLDWLEADLSADAHDCELAVVHLPRFSSGVQGDRLRIAPIYRTLYRNGVEMMLSGNDHVYERFAPQDPSGEADPARGVRQWVVGTGGKNLNPWGETIQPNSEFRARQLGVLWLTLGPGAYAWEFRSIDKGVIDSGDQVPCH